jgi:hypothetical protein
LRPQRGPPGSNPKREPPESGGSPSDMVSESEHAGAEVELVHVALLGLTWKVTLTLSASASADDLQLGRQRRFPGVDVEACPKPDRDWQPLPTFADLARLTTAWT